jgi:hypothetical protein
MLGALAMLALLPCGCGSDATHLIHEDEGSPGDSAPPFSAGGVDGVSLEDADFLLSLGVEEEELAALRAYSVAPRSDDELGEKASLAGDLTYYEVQLPHTGEPPNPSAERALLTAYLDHPKDLRLAKALGIYHLVQSFVNPLRGHRATPGATLQHSVLCSYFLNRAKDLGSNSAWVDFALSLVEGELDQIAGGGSAPNVEEYHDAHVYYRQVFHGNQEQNRYKALDRLLGDYVVEPKDAYTSFALMTFNLWMGGETSFDDPTMLNNFVLGSYFQMRVFDLSQELEEAYNRDPEHAVRFRMAAEAGGFGLLERRWLAKAHDDQNAVRLIDDEHRAWWRIQPAIHSFSLGLPFFDEADNFDEGLDVYYSAYPYCEMVPVRTCSNLPRFPFNLLSFVLGLVDFQLKDGNLDAAKELLNFRFAPTEAENWAQWNLGRESWLHREQNVDDIFELYQNDDPFDDPVNFETKRRKWGEVATVCSVCHETQGKPQRLAEIEAPQTLPPPELRSVVDWPPVTTAWYGATLRR